MATPKREGQKTPKKNKTKTPKKPAKKAAQKKPSGAKKILIPVKRTAIPKKPVKKAAPKILNLNRGGAVTADNTTLDTLYILDESGNTVTLEVNAGAEGQTSDMTIKLDDNVITENHAGDFSETPLGSNNGLNGKKLSIVATIADTSRNTNFTSLTIHLKGGFNPADFPLSKSVEEEGGSMDYLCLIEFLKPEL